MFGWGSWCHASVSERPLGLKLSCRWKMGAAALHEGEVHQPSVCSIKMTKPMELCPHQYPSSMVACHSESASVISLACTLLVCDLWSLFGKMLWRSLDCGSQLVPFIPVSCFCCLMVLFLRSTREEGRWPYRGLMSFWIIHILWGHGRWLQHDGV